MIRTVAIGKNIHLNDVLDMEHTLEVQLQSKNLFDVSKVVTDETIINNGDRTLTAHQWGVASSTTLRTVCPELKAGDVATFSFETESDTKYIYLYPAGIDWNSGDPLEITEGMLGSTIVFYCKIEDGINTPALISNIQIELGRETTDDYSPYITDFTGQEVVVSGKNLLDLSSIIGTSTTANGGTLTCGEDGGITGSGTPTNSVSFYGIPINVPKGDLTFSASGTFTNMVAVIYLWDADNTSLAAIGVSGVKKATFNLDSYPTFHHATLELKRNNNNVEMMGTMYIQLELGTEATEYEPYKPVYTCVADAEGIVRDIKSYSPVMNLTQESNDIIIKCSYIPQSMRELPIAKKLEAINSCMQQVYNRGIVDGKQAEYDAFWESYLKPKQGGAGLAYLFGGPGWDDNTFRPPKGAVLTSAGRTGTSASMMFIGSRITDLKAICEEREFTLDFSATTGFSQVFCDCSITAVPTIDTRKATSINNLFWNPSELVTVEKLILKDEGSQTCDRTFHLVGSLQNIVIEGKFGNSVDVSAATNLSKSSIKYFVNALLDSADRKTLTLSRTAVDKAFETYEGANNGSTSQDWIDLIDDKIAPTGKWTISLV